MYIKPKLLIVPELARLINKPFSCTFTMLINSLQLDRQRKGGKSAYNIDTLS
jgi:hypothetical protein